MDNSTLKELPKSTIEIEITVFWDEVKDYYEKILNKAVKELEVAGFRKGKAPKKIAEKKLDKNKIYEEVIKELIPKIYSEEIKKYNLHPITAPKITLVNAKENTDWIIKILLALKPIIKLNQYQEKIKQLKKEKVKIWTPSSKEEEKNEKISIDEILEAVLQEVEIELSDFLVEEETNKLLSDLIDQVQKLGLSIDQYLAAKGKTSQQLREEYQKQAKKNLSIEFILSEIAEKENIFVDQNDIDNLLAKIKDEKEKEKIRQNSYYLAHLIRQQKTLDFLKNL